MYIIIAGVNTITRRLVRDLVKDHDIVVVEEDEIKAERIYETGATVINGSPTNLSVLKDAGIAKADILVSALNNPNENMMVSMIGKKFGVPKSVARVEDTEYLDIYDMLEITTIEYTDIVYSEFISVIEHPSMRKIANVGQGHEIIEVVVDEESQLQGLRIDEVKALRTFPKQDIEFSAVLRGDNVHDPDDTFRLEKGDSVVLIVRPSVKDDLHSLV